MFQSVANTLIQVILPLSIPVAAGALLVRFRGMETKNLLTLALYFLTPGIVFHTLSNAQISFEEVNKTALYCLVNLVLLWALAGLAGKVLRLSAPDIAGLTLISTLTNNVNYGLPLVLLAFGTLGLEKAAVYVVFQMLIVNTIGVYFAARSNFSAKNAVISVFSLPAIYAALLAVLLRSLNLALPQGIEKGIAMVAQAYSPIVLTILGAQMAKVQTSKLEGTSRSAFWSGLSIRLLLSPFVAYLGLSVVGISGILFSVFFILSSMPVAVNAVILAEKFDASPSIVSKCILWTTLASLITLPILIVLVS